VIFVPKSATVILSPKVSVLGVVPPAIEKPTKPDVRVSPDTVVPVMAPPDIETLLAACVAIVPSPKVVLWSPAVASSSLALPAVVQDISSALPAPAVTRPSILSAADMFCILA
jgi:hypothetical protein